MSTELDWKERVIAEPMTSIKHEIITDELDEAFYKIRSRSKIRHAGSIQPSKYFQCGFMISADRLGYAWTNEPQLPDWEFGGALGNEGHEILQRRFAFTDYPVLVPNFLEDEAKRNAARAKGELQPAIEYPFTSYTASVHKQEEARKLGLGRFRRDVVIKGRKLKSNGKPRWNILEIKMWKDSDFNPIDEDAKRHQNNKLADHEAQVQLYMYMSEDEDGAQVEDGLIYIVNRERPAQRRLERVQLRWIYIGPELERLERIQSNIMRGELAEPEPSRGPCSLCPYYDLCPLKSKEKRGKRPPTIEQVYGSATIPLITHSRAVPAELERVEESAA